MSRFLANKPDTVHARMLSMRTQLDMLAKAQGSETGAYTPQTASVLIKYCMSQSCSKCVPCRVGLERMLGYVDSYAAGPLPPARYQELKALAEAVYNTTECEVGSDPAKVVLNNIDLWQQQ